MEKFTINVKIFVTTTIDEGSVIWRIDGYLLDMFKTWKSQKACFTPNFEMFGIRWYAGCYPNGLNQSGEVEIDIVPLETYESLEIEYEIECK
eukprot:80496_1